MIGVLVLGMVGTVEKRAKAGYSYVDTDQEAQAQQKCNASGASLVVGDNKTALDSQQY